MASPNLNMRDPVMYRILRATHHRTGDKWCIYPMYDFAHGESDSIEGITHSICTLEFENHRPLYDWYVRALDIYAPQQIEFARLNLTYTVMSKRKLLELVRGQLRPRLGRPAAADDLRPAAAGLHARGDPRLLRRIGVAKQDSVIDVALLEYSVREDLNRRAPRVMAVLRPLRLVIDNYPEGQAEELDAVNNPEDEGMGRARSRFRGCCTSSRTTSASRRRRSISAVAGAGGAAAMGVSGPLHQRGQGPGERRSRRGPLHLRSRTRGGNTPDGRKVKGTIHWVSAAHAVAAEARLYEQLFDRPNPDDVPAGPGLQGRAQPEIAGDGPLPGRAESRRGEAGRAVPVRAAGVFLCRSGLQPEKLGVQPHGDAPRHVGEDREGRRRTGLARPLAAGDAPIHGDHRGGAEHEYARIDRQHVPHFRASQNVGERPPTQEQHDRRGPSLARPR